ncbi:MAG TPA: alpha/beta hydrolase [Pyrinomonadaceae bacterium]|nr:alpha/beta hydrolase [Pyrinomonadaceae bacterium]
MGNLDVYAESMKLVLLPGLDGTGRLFEPLVQALPSHLSPVVISYPNEKPLSYTELLRFVKVQLPSDENYVLLAESFSGPLAIEVSATQPPNLKALILSATFVSNPALVPQSMSFVLRGLFFTLEPSPLVVSRYLLGEKPPFDLVETFLSAKRSVPPDVLAFRTRSVMNADVRRAFAACRLPILYLFAKQDRLIKRRSLAEMQRLKPEMSIVEIDGPHLLLQREPVKCVEAITQFLSCAL